MGQYEYKNVTHKISTDRLSPIDIQCRR